MRNLGELLAERRKCAFPITREMERARARLEAYRDKIQPYPPYPIEEEPEVIVKKIYPYICVDKKSLELQKRIVALESKVEELGDRKRKKDTSKYIIK